VPARPPAWAFFAGCVGAFVACCILGNALARREEFPGFVRFHQLLAPESFYYPTALQVRGLVRARLRPGATAVIVGGSSVLNGVGQVPSRIWTRALARRLGRPFVVINLALRAGRPQELGMLAAEALVKAGRPVVYVADVRPCTVHDDPTGLLHRYQFWDFRYRGFLLDDPEREAHLAAILARPDAGARDELRLGLWLNSRLGLAFADLWSTVAYRQVFTVWNFLAHPRFWRPRRTAPDRELRVPPRGYYHRYAFDAAMRTVRTTAAPCGPEHLAAIQADLRAIMPAEIRRRAVLVITRDSPYYGDHLAPEERAQYDRNVEATRRAAEAAGVWVVDALRGWTAEDYVDRAHLSEQGGAKLAAALAPAIRERAATLP
jgi:hypothetical protein